MPETPQRSGRSAALVALGILLSRLAGLARQKLFAHLMGSGLEAAAFSAATRIPNVLQNLLGEGVLSASFIPVYASLRAKGQLDEARRMAGAVFGLLALLVGVIVAVGLLGAPWLVRFIAPGYSGEAYELTVTLVRIIFPGTGVLVLSAWCLGILNSHKQFFLSYAAPVVWNGAIIAVLLGARGAPGSEVITWVAWATVAGSVLQFLVQLPNVMKLLGRFEPRPSISLPSVVEVLRGFGPAVAARGVVQVSAYVDLALVTLVSVRAVSVLTYAQTIALLPISLFGMSIAAAELPEMSADAVKSLEERSKALQERLKAGLERMSFFVVPSAVAFLLLGDLLCGVLLESGRFTAKDSRLGWYLLLGSGVALLAQTSGRLFSSTLYALKDTKTPFRFAVIRVTLGVALGFVSVTYGAKVFGLPTDLAAVFLTLTTSVTAWLEMSLLKRAVAKQLGGVPSIAGRLVRLWVAAFVAAGVAVGVKVALTLHFGARPMALEEWGGQVLPFPLVPELMVWRFDVSTLVTSTGLIGVYGAGYFVITALMGIPQAGAVVRRVLRRK
ncbi:MAG: murein biosynthesis integral membrane protein MurJ [Myxococcales bacterium]|nr:murein biosynthesis integral membrane protein MurJ [Myxococcales bacterium]MDP3503638.1 murein biosynthesis integral membrane protein MurJ [Myxococcales bacterium]